MDAEADAKIAAKLTTAMRTLLVVLSRVDESDMTVLNAASHRGLRNRGLAVVGSERWRSRITDRGRDVAAQINRRFDPQLVLRSLSRAQAQALATDAGNSAPAIVAEALLRHGLIEHQPERFALTDRGHAVIAEMNPLTQT